MSWHRRRKPNFNVREGAYNSLAQSNSRCRRTESIVSLERGVCSCAELQVFSCYRGWKESCKATRAFNNIETQAVIKLFFLQSKAPKKIQAILTETLGEHAQSYATFKNWVDTSLNVVIFPPVMRLVLDDPKRWPPRRLLIKFTS